MLKNKFKNSNTLSAAIEFIFDATITFFVYRYIIKNIGVSALGVWSLALSFTALTSVGSSGFASSAVKFVSKYFVHNNIEKVQKIIGTTAITVLVFATSLVLIVRILLSFFYNLILTEVEYTALGKIINLVFASFIITSVARVFLSSLDGLNLIYVRSRIGISSKIIYAASNIFLVPLYGLLGLAISQLILGMILLINSFLILRKRIGSYSGKTAYIFDKKIFKEIFSYGANFQITSLFQMLSDPLTRFYLKDIGGLAAVGLFEVVYKIFIQIRQLIVVIMNTYVPIVSMKNELDRATLKELYVSFFGKVMVMALIGMSIIFPFLKLTLGFFNVSSNNSSIIYSIIVSISIYVNLLAASGFIFNLGTGNIKINTFSALIFVIVNIIASYSLGRYYGEVGVLMGWSCAHILSSIFLLILFWRKEGIRAGELFSINEIIIHLLLVISLSCILFIQKNYDILSSLIISICIYLAFIVLLINGSKKPKEMFYLIAGKI